MARAPYPPARLANARGSHGALPLGTAAASADLGQNPRRGTNSLGLLVRLGSGCSGADVLDIVGRIVVDDLIDGCGGCCLLADGTLAGTAVRRH